MCSGLQEDDLLLTALEDEDRELLELAVLNQALFDAAAHFNVKHLQSRSSERLLTLFPFTERG